MKRRLTGVVAALLILFTGTTNVYAALSPATEAAYELLAAQYQQKVGSVTAASSSGTIMSMTVEKVSAEVVSEATGIAAGLGNVSEMISIVDLRPSVNVAVSTVAKGVTVGMAVSGVNSGDNVYILHKRSDKSWETLKPIYVGNNYLEVKMYSFSPVAVVKYQSNVTLVPTPQDTSAEEQDKAEQEAKDLAAKITNISVVLSSNGNMITPTKNNAGISDVAYAKAQAGLLGGTVIGMADYSTSATNVSAMAKGSQVTLRVTGLSAGENIYILHKRSNGWETLKPYSIVNGYLAVKMYSLSPIAVIRYPTGVILTPTEQDTTAEELDKEEREVQELAAKIIRVSGSSSAGTMSITKTNALMSDVAFARAQAAPSGGTILGMAAFTTTTAESTIKKGIQLSLGVSDLKAGDNVYVLHKLSNGSWETLKPYSIVDGYLEVKMYALSTASPIAVVRYPAGVTLTPTVQDTSAEEQNTAELEAQSLAGKITYASATYYAGSLVLNRSSAAVSDVVYMKGQAGFLNGTVLGMAEVTTTADASLIATGIDVMLYVTDLKSSDNVYVWHKLSSGVWETLKPYSVGNGYLGVKMYSLSPVAVVRYPAGVTLSTASQDTSVAVNQEAQDYADRITLASAISSSGSLVSLTKGTASVTYVAIARGMAEPLGGTVLGMADFTTTANADTVANGILATLYVYDLKVGDNIYVLHMLSDGSWEYIKPYVVGSGYVSFRLYSLSPIAVVRYPAGVNITPTQQIPSNGNGNTNSGDNQGGSSGVTPGVNPPGGNGGNQNNSQNNSQSNSQNQTNDNNQSNSQTNNQNNPVNVSQNVTVTYPDTSGQYSNGYGDGYKDGFSAGQQNGGGSSSSGGSGSAVKSPKTDASLPALPFVAMFAAAGLAVCRKKNS